jgi:hypothetical protein
LDVTRVLDGSPSDNHAVWSCSRVQRPGHCNTYVDCDVQVRCLKPSSSSHLKISRVLIAAQILFQRFPSSSRRNEHVEEQGKHHFSETKRTTIAFLHKDKPPLLYFSSDTQQSRLRRRFTSKWPGVIRWNHLRIPFHRRKEQNRLTARLLACHTKEGVTVGNDPTADPSLVCHATS